MGTHASTAKPPASRPVADQHALAASWALLDRLRESAQSFADMLAEAVETEDIGDIALKDAKAHAAEVKKTLAAVDAIGWPDEIAARADGRPKA